MASIERLIPFIKKWEGGYVDDKDDLGGATNMGVTLATYRAYCKRKGYPYPTPTRLKVLTEADWKEILRTMYWDRWCADEIESQPVANILVDWLWGSGSPAIRIPQRLLKVKVDGIVGPCTLKAVNSCNPRELFDRIKIARFDYIDSICRARPQNDKFRRGWLNRLNDLTYDM